MEIFIAILLIAFIAVEILNNKRLWDLEKKINEKEKIKLTQKQKKKMEELKKNFDNLMEYDENIAMKRK
ncbi:MAG: hypothetical protein IJI98_11210 [Methanosphaera sp.]|nr:hypothetical protein [Methanobrevibacter sp.]MBQ6754194.1 hypothetical protein [Bacteroidales bacterium]MBR0351302.1 hypothetical protein [Clostridia bacterium]MBR0473248.1 hypothetical protein [Methanosphaera sp.]